MPAIIKATAIAFISIMTFTSCVGDGTSGGKTSLSVYAAASLTEAFRELSSAFKIENRETSVILNFDGSQRLRLQLENGAQADLFASADPRQIELARLSGLLFSEAVTFTSNSLVLIVPTTDFTGSTGYPVNSLADLSHQGVKLAVAQAEVPAGIYSRMVIHRMAENPEFGPQYATKVLANIVTEEPNVRSVLQKVELGEVDAGFVYYSDFHIASNVSMIPIPDESNITAKYTVATLKNSNHRKAADAFIQYLLSDTGQRLLQEHGFGTVTKEINPLPTTISRLRKKQTS